MELFGRLYLKKISYIILLLLASFLLVSCNKGQELYRIHKDGLYGFVDSLGNIIIEPQYKYVSPFTKEGYACVISDLKLDIDAEKILSNENSTYSDLSTELDSCIRITYGYINKENELKIDTTNHIIIPFLDLPYWGNRQLVELAKDYAKGNLEFRSEILDELSLIDGLYLFQDKESHLYGYKDENNIVRIEAKYKWGRNFSYGLAVVGLNNDSEINFESNLDIILTERQNSAAVIDTGGKVVASKYTSIHDYNKKGLTWALSTSISLEEGSSIKRDWVQLDRLGNIKLGPISNVAYIYNNIDYPICVIDFGLLGGYKYSFIDEKGNFISDYNNDKLLFLSFDGENELFADVTYFSNGFAGVKGFNDKGESAWFYIDKDIETKSEPYDTLLAFSEGYAAVKELTHLHDMSSHMGKWGFVKIDLPDSTINQAIPFSFSECGNFHNGLAYFKNEGSTLYVEGYINKRGKIVWQTKNNK